MRATSFLVCAAAAAVAGACASPDPGVEVAYYKPPDVDPTDPCPPDGCGGNSPVTNGVYFWRLHIGTVPGTPSDEGVQITGVQRYGVPLKLQLADGDRLQGVDAMGNVIAEGTTLPGTRINLLVNGDPYQIRIAWAADSEAFWVEPSAKIWLYTFYYRPLFGPDQYIEHPLCSEGDGDPSLVTAMVFGGDLYDPDTKKITVGPATDGWMNIACADSALYKMHKSGHTSAAGARIGLKTTVAMRRAMLNAWTSNVCGTGEAFTRQGEPITLRESRGVFDVAPYNAPAQSREAIWSEDGAVCLNTHRLEEDDPDIYDTIADACPDKDLPPCDAFLGDWTSYGHVLTGNP